MLAKKIERGEIVTRRGGARQWVEENVAGQQRKIFQEIFGVGDCSTGGVQELH